jgi:hypothetical protein
MADKIMESESESESGYRHGYDWDVFWAIENQDEDDLTTVCESMLSTGYRIDIYFNGAPRWHVFTDNEALKINIHAIDTTPLEHARALGWDAGVVILGSHATPATPTTPVGSD